MDKSNRGTNGHGSAAQAARERGIAELRQRALASGNAMESGDPAIDGALWAMVYDHERAGSANTLNQAASRSAAPSQEPISRSAFNTWRWS